MSDIDLDAIEARLDDAYDEVVRLCDGKRWLMSMPPDASRDSDLLITASLDDAPALVAEVRRLRALVARLREQLQHECPHGEMSWSGYDLTTLDDPAKVWVCDNCGKVLDEVQP
jgi:hypothetical protein